MSLQEPTTENVHEMMDVMRIKLQIVNPAALDAENFDLNRYDEIKELYDMVSSKDKFSVSEMDAIVSELGKLTKGR
ncbi:MULTISPECIES: DUF1128 domain-containing protein [Sinobaca]|uniref:Uncharacterized protein YfkK (UPF0435 family) n=1 Tax=Sinobaca qinghaiensis TaxID=342944 RepID=A0A419V6C8_9BACL|nr:MULTISPECIES: DUF1128 domain-containing protein [Sinobaca]RKD75401.1 uncharacterized protein YfkK (UPF0435 family) [Sinobaca qinghaiensis]